MTVEEAKSRLQQAGYRIFQITKELDRIDELWRRLCAPNGPRWSDERRSTVPSGFTSLMMDLIVQRERAAAEAYRFVREVEQELISLSHSHPQEARALDMRYIKDSSYEHIGNKIGYTRQGAYYLVQRGLAEYAKLLTPVDKVYCQE